MRWLDETEKRKKREAHLKAMGWHKWFAWHPVYINGEWIWLEQVERNFKGHDTTSSLFWDFGIQLKEFEYRFPQEATS